MGEMLLIEKEDNEIQKKRRNKGNKVIRCIFGGVKIRRNVELFAVFAACKQPIILLQLNYQSQTFLMGSLLPSFLQTQSSVILHFPLKSSMLYFRQYILPMEKHKWQKVTTLKPNQEPSPRWGHASASTSSQIILFGGYADSNYMNDLWTFDTTHMTWTQCQPTGKAPSPRSNATLHFDQKNRRAVLFGGGGQNKLRFNDVHVLDWDKKEWRQLRPKEAEKYPWERTYHSSELVYPYLIIFGGQGIADLDDLWAFNLENSEWVELAKDSKEERPCARRFHSSALINSTLYIIAGCHDKYRCLCDIFSIDLAPFLSDQQTTALQWKQLKLKNCSFLTRWGHTSTVFNGKVYIFGGRFSSDLQDILILDPTGESIKVMKVNGDIPRPRRRHSANFVGSSLIVFGGFNGQYFNDLNYISVYELSSKLQLEMREEGRQSWVNCPFLADHIVQTKDHLPFYIHKGLIADKFADRSQIDDFFQQIQKMFTLQQLQELFQILYSGIGTIKEQYFLSDFQFILFQTTIDRTNFIRKSIKPDCHEQGSLLHKNTITSTNILAIEDQGYFEYLQTQRISQYHDLVIVLNQEYYIPVNQALLAKNSTYFRYLLQWTAQSHIGIDLQQQLADIRVFQVMVNYVQTGYLIIPEDLDDRCWVGLVELAQYFCLSNLVRICQNQLIAKISRQNCGHLLDFALENKLNELFMHCGEFYFRVLLENGQITYQKEQQHTSAEKEKVVDYYKNLFQFDLLQHQIKKEPTKFLKGHQPSKQEKQNQQAITN